ncbi:MAG: YkgJ family cysteine cluster protein [Anaerolineaceae bacterium]|nr:YkgJ family cysteine cluster protein [Anaerolineaceae bacterium]
MAVEQTEYCTVCEKMCCKYFTVPLEKPKDKDDFDAMLWYILHEGVSIFIDEEGDWFVNVASRCRKLGDDGLCMAYEKRPKICRDHTDEVCERNEGPYDFKKHFFKAKELRAYAKKVLAKRKKKKNKK